MGRMKLGSKLASHNNHKMAVGFNGDFAKFIPFNLNAQNLFSSSSIYAQENDTFHRRLMKTGSEPLLASDEAVESSTDYDTQADTDSEGLGVRSDPNLGLYVLSFNDERAPQFLRLFRTGRGKGGVLYRGVDILLARPGDIRGKFLASVHLVFRFNQESGFHMLRGSPKVPVEINTNGTWKALKFEEEHLIYQSTTMIRAGTCEYALKYTIEETHREAYFDQRDGLFEAKRSGKVQPHRKFRYLPGDLCVVRGSSVEFDTAGSGSFG